MSYYYSKHSIIDHPDLSRAAAERSLILQALSERPTAVQISHPQRTLTRLLPERMLRRTALRPVVAPEPAAAGVVI